MEQLNFMEEMGAEKNLSTPIFDYRPGVFSKEESEFFREKLIRETSWSQKSALMYGKEVLTPRLTAWFGDEGTDDAIQGEKSGAFPWTKELLEIKSRVEKLAGMSFNSVLLNYYRDGNDSVSWHSDGDGVPGKNMFVVSVSFGQEREFDIRSKINPQDKFKVLLEDGSYFFMKGDFQDKWQHRIAKSKKSMKARINLTFRVILGK
ncbi:alpha-ketoglutarate-dependent dioxygenase AlkB [Pedobacter sp. L105]|uniref:alpha-ketoglutarate-dependent dioxygenase AlkB family protein n=1 Tax=Pedobacter sp. L105 TaxID=1641871 RepID=UPI00131D5470|nr:alpha-ketoglutarate-dependent dioxygenase AlkB [Pedobacter sp. L105]